MESTIVPSKSERRPSNVWTCGGAENDPVADMVGEGLLRGDARDANGEEMGRKESRYLFKRRMFEREQRECQENTIYW